MEESGALRFTVNEYNDKGSHYIWIPHWREGLLGLSSPSASNAKEMDILEFKNGILVSVLELGSDREDWVHLLKQHGQLRADEKAGEADPLYLAVTEKIIHLGATVEHVLYACGFPYGGPDGNPRCKRDRKDLHLNDVLYYLKTRGGTAFKVTLVNGQVESIDPAEHVSYFWTRPAGR